MTLQQTQTPVDRSREIVRRTVIRMNTLHDDFISVPTWGKYMRAIGMHRPVVQKVLRFSWNRRA